MTQTKQEIRTIFDELVEEKALSELDGYIESKGIPWKFVPGVLVDSVCVEVKENDLTELETSLTHVEDEFVKEEVSHFVNAVYDTDFWKKKFEQKLDLEEIRYDLEDELVLFLINTEPYGYAPRTYWDSRVKNVDSLRALGKFVNDDLEGFIGTYASNWLLDSKEFSDD
ncbi:hypothetical protein EY653_05545 [Enterococcus faecalis]|uniref:hypothetical protein n=1 Tax=Enterococcus faecalis TaxID=1351 RepID=UPI001AD6AF7E|nr:hypothetical protein [Enterococcus faecalis]MBO6438751.1 hypothetical protein [Enterococcus faecalis]MBO6453360.1 hypothetical protein [Enterococcus faecalis]